MPRSTKVEQDRLCNYLGHLENENDASVAVTGCADDRNHEGKMYLTIISKRSPYQKSFSLDVNGNVKLIEAKSGNTVNNLLIQNIIDRRGFEIMEGDEIKNAELEAKAANAETNGVPCSIKVKIRLGIDASALKTIEKSLQRTYDNWLAEVFTHAQVHYHHPTLQHRINFEVCLLKCFHIVLRH